MSEIGLVGCAGKLTRDSRGATIVEFAFVAPVLILFLMFLFDTGYYLYARSILTGEVLRAGRASTLETATDTNRAALDLAVETAVKRLVSGGTLEFDRMAYKSYGRAQAKAEAFIDSNNNNVCDNNESFDDANRNNVRDLDSGTSGQGGARDVTIYTVTLHYNRLFPMSSLLGWSQEVTMRASTLLRNQPFDKQAEALVGHCT
ncbi:TadE family protein [Sphingomonas paucimobilis]|uniref:TadE/TadG family type IV pilus assembly protein n=1 Tax=Sphingobium sp. DC-2 TaxID=1303256 RepID=UPI00044607CD|nr:tight adherence pilus pseudopilin TadF [Sphingobium sp. DC-2]EZP72491.1 TadE family protein [Sphingomonas paucimobilis]